MWFELPAVDADDEGADGGHAGAQDGDVEFEEGPDADGDEVSCRDMLVLLNSHVLFWWCVRVGLVVLLKPTVSTSRKMLITVTLEELAVYLYRDKRGKRTQSPRQT